MLRRLSWPKSSLVVIHEWPPQATKSGIAAYDTLTPSRQNGEIGGRTMSLVVEQRCVEKVSQPERPGVLRSVELSTGAGGLALGTHDAGFRHAALVEYAPNACDTLRTNARLATIPDIDDWSVLQTDVRTVDFTGYQPVELVAGGPPCQPFSIGGKHQGMDDDRNMIPEFIRAVRTLTPRAFIMENVRGLLRPAFLPYYSYVMRQLSYPTLQRRVGEPWHDHAARLEKANARSSCSDPHYHVSYHLVNAADYGVPQLRHRVFVIGLRCDLDAEWRFPEPTHSQQALERAQWITGAYWQRHDLPTPARPPDWTKERARLLASVELAPLLPWTTVRDAISDLPAPVAGQEAPGYHNHRLQTGARAYTGHTGSPLDWPAKALKAGVHGVPGGENMLALEGGGVRYLTTREAARLQTFPDGWIFEGAWTEAMRQLGNAVPMRLAAVVAHSVAQALSETPVSYSHQGRLVAG